MVRVCYGFVLWFCAWRIRFSAIFRYSGCSSMPMNSYCSSIAAFPVEPDPVNGSRIVPFGGVTSRQR